MNTTFSSFDIDKQLLWALTQMEYTTPTPIQEQAIPVALQGSDIMGTAQTGTGKTAAFSIPLVQHLIKNQDSVALVLVPTRELGKQIMEVMHSLLKAHKNIQTAFIIGGEPMPKQMMQIRKRPRLIVGTPGRINDHLERGSLKLKDVDFLVLDETDRMLDMGFSIQLDRIFNHMPNKRQTLMFSATLPKDILTLSKNYLNEPVRIAVGGVSKVAQNIKQEVIYMPEEDKYDKLVSELYEREGSVIIFVKTKFGTERLAKKLIAADLKSCAIHGDLKQSRRERVIKDFRDSKFRILVATDVVARGLDISHIEHVINYDLPQVAEDYVHRIGRTARAGKAGFALCFVAPKDQGNWRDIEKIIDMDTVVIQGKPTAGSARGGKGAGAGRSRGRSGGAVKSAERNRSSEYRKSGSFSRGASNERGSERSGAGRPARTEGRADNRSSSFGRGSSDRPSAPRGGAGRPARATTDERSASAKPSRTGAGRSDERTPSRSSRPDARSTSSSRSGSGAKPARAAYSGGDSEAPRAPRGERREKSYKPAAKATGFKGAAKPEGAASVRTTRTSRTPKRTVMAAPSKRVPRSESGSLKRKSVAGSKS